jgi:hypothetical protein
VPTATRKRKPKPPTGNPVGPRPLISTPIMEQLLEARRRGLSLTKSAQWAGIHYASLKRWMVRGEAAIDKPVRLRSAFDVKCIELCRLLEKVDAEWIMRCENVLALSMLPGSSNEAWNRASTDEKDRAVSTAKFKLTHQAAEFYNTKTSTQITGKDGGPLDVSMSNGLDVFKILLEAAAVEDETEE